MAASYKNIRRTPGFIADYIEIREHIKQYNPVAYQALPNAMKTILDVIDNHPHGWPVKRKKLAGTDYIFHLAIVNIAYRRLHVRYFVDDQQICHLLTAWIDGQDEPRYQEVPPES
jgi:hypothetical protein